MKALFLTIALMIPAASVLSDTAIPADAQPDVGRRISVIGRGSVWFTDSGDIWVSIQGKDHPYVTGIISNADSRKFPNLRTYSGQTLALAGVVKLTPHGPQILVTDPSQLQVK
jgi:hypothetical protein